MPVSIDGSWDQQDVCLRMWDRPSVFFRAGFVLSSTSGVDFNIFGFSLRVPISSSLCDVGVGVSEKMRKMEGDGSVGALVEYFLVTVGRIHDGFDGRVICER